jgi:hypothetical protein
MSTFDTPLHRNFGGFMLMPDTMTPPLAIAADKMMASPKVRH